MSLPCLQKDGTGEADTPSGGRSCNWWLIYHLWRLNTLQAGRAEHLASLCSPVNLGDSYLVPFLTLHWRRRSPPPQDVSCELHSSSQPASWEDMLGFGEIPIDSLPVHFSRSVRSNSLQPHGLQHARLPCPSPSPGACSNSCPSSQWCHSTISSSVISYSLCLPSFPTNVCLVKAIVFPVVMHGCESWTIKKAECPRIDDFQQWCWKKLLRVPWTSRRSNQSVLKEISPE